MARMPGAVWRPIPASTSKMSAFDIVCIHTMVMSLPGCDAYFRSIAPGVNAHFGTGHDGTIYQWVDTTYRSGANYNGNYHIISIENADRGTGFPDWDPNDASQVPAFTAAQIEANARICAWAHKLYGIPLELIPDAKPGRRGIGYHRQGVIGYMVAGAEQWSTKTGKACPGNRRIAQIPQIITRARQIAAGIQEDFMATMSDAEKAALMEVVYTFLPGKSGRSAGPGWVRIDNTTNGVARIEALVRASAANAGITQAQIEQIVAGVSDRLDDGFDVTLQPKTDPA